MLGSVGNNSARVLIVDDDLALGQELAEYLNMNGLQGRTCGDIETALKYIDEDVRVRVVVTDIVLGNLSGLELLRKLQKSRRANIQTLVFSGYTNVDNLLAALRLGAVDFLPKPVGLDEFLEAVRNALARGEAIAKKAQLSSSRVLLEARRKRDSLFGDELFEDPAWNMLLDLHECTLRGLPVSVTDLCIAAGTSATTALRRLTVLEQMGLVERVHDTSDRRRVFVRQTKRCADQMRSFSEWFEKLVSAEE